MTGYHYPIAKTITLEESSEKMEISGRSLKNRLKNQIIMGAVKQYGS
jgi:hypothetical protein